MDCGVNNIYLYHIYLLCKSSVTNHHHSLPAPQFLHTICLYILQKIINNFSKNYFKKNSFNYGRYLLNRSGRHLKTNASVNGSHKLAMPGNSQKYWVSYSRLCIFRSVFTNRLLIIIAKVSAIATNIGDYAYDRWCTITTWTRAMCLTFVWNQSFGLSTILHTC